MRTTCLCLMVLLLVAGGCDKKTQAPAPRVPNVTVATAQLKDAPLIVGNVGQVLAKRSVALQPQVTGRLAALHFAEGDMVREGQLLATIDPLPFEAVLNQTKGTLAKDWASAEQAERDFMRYKDLLAKSVVSKEDFEQRRTQMETGWQQVKADQANLETARINLNYCSIYAPFTGVAGYQLVKAGNTVTAYQSTLVTINQIQPILVRFAVSEADLSLVRKYWKNTPLPARVKTPKETGRHRERGVLTAIDNAVDPQTGTISLQAQFDNADLGLWPGQFVTAQVALTVEKDVLQVPVQALLKRQDGTFVFVVTDDSTAEMRPVKAGRVVDDVDVAILEGLKPGERVITEGLILVAPGAKVNVTKGGAGT